MTQRDILNLIGTKIHINIGYIIVPPDVDRDNFIANCYSKEEVSIYPETGGTSYNRVKITCDALQTIEFPEEGDAFGSMVLFFLHPIQRYPIVFGVLDKKNECKLLQWKQFKLVKSYKNSEVDIVGDAARSSLLIKVKGGNGNSSNFTIMVQDPESKGTLNLMVQGNINLMCDCLSLLNRDLEIVSKGSVKLTNNLTEIKTLNLSIECVEERTDDYKENPPKEIEEALGSALLKAKSLDLVIGDSTIHIENVEDGDKSVPLICINGGSRQGLINIEELTERLNNLVKEVDKFRENYNNHKHEGSTCPSGPVMIQPPISTGGMKQPISSFDKKDYEDTTVKH